jgi:hypothetical protein
MLWRWLAAIYAWICSFFGAKLAPRPAQPTFRVVHVARFDQITSDPPKMHWSPCHPSVVKRFKASMTCAYGHSLTLGGHAIDADGTVHPSVVCPARGCSFHDFVRLDGWSFGDVR